MKIPSDFFRARNLGKKQHSNASVLPILVSPIRALVSDNIDKSQRLEETMTRPDMIKCMLVQWRATVYIGDIKLINGFETWFGALFSPWSMTKQETVT